MTAVPALTKIGEHADFTLNTLADQFEGLGADREVAIIRAAIADLDAVHLRPEEPDDREVYQVLGVMRSIAPRADPQRMMPMARAYVDLVRASAGPFSAEA